MDYLQLEASHLDQFVALAQQTTIKTERLFLRPLTLQDLDDYHAYSSDARLLRFQYPPSTSLEESRKNLVHYNLIQPLGRFGIELLSEKRLIGHASLRILGHQAEIGYILNANYHHQGYALECALALRDLAISIPAISELVARVDVRNLASIQLLERIGLVRSAVSPDQNLFGEAIETAFYQLDLSKD